MVWESVQVKLRLPSTWLNEIKRRCELDGIPAEAPRGRTGGHAEWIRRLIARELGETVQDQHAVLSEQRRGKPNPAHPANMRLWLADQGGNSGTQFGIRIQSSRRFLEDFGLSVHDLRFLCGLERTPGSKGAPTGWHMVVVEVHRGNELGLRPGFYRTPIRPARALEIYGQDAFCPRVLTEERLSELDDWLESHEASLDDSQ